MGGWEMDVNNGELFRLTPGSTFSVCHGDEHDLEAVTIKQVNSTHVLLKSRSDLNGWTPRGLIEGAIAEASAQQFPHMPQ